VLDWYSRYILSWALSQSLEIDFVLDAVDQALIQATLKSGTAIRAAISPARPIRNNCKTPLSKSAWMAADVPAITSSPNTYGTP
jgi:transposase InsO family protein